MAVITKDLGAVSAYAIAVEHGYTGTEEEFAQEIANASANAQAAAQSATAAAGSAASAESDATAAAASRAGARSSELNASSSAQSASASQNAAGQSKNAAIAAQTAAEAAQTAAEAAQTGAETAQTAAETAQTAAEAAAATAAAAYGTDLLADDYSTTKTYAAGEYAIYDGDLYRCTTAIATAEAWTAAHWTLVQVGTELGGLKSAFAQCGITFTPTWTDGKYVAGNNVVIDNENYSIADFNVTNLQGDIEISTFGASTVGWILLDSNSTQIERSLFTDSTGITYNFKRTVTIPQNGALLRVSCAKSLKASQSVVYLVEANDFLPCVANLSTIFDSVRKFSVYSVEVSNLTASTNKVPYDNFHGSIITTGKLDASQQQLALSYDQRMFIRRKFNTWSAWKEMAIGTPSASSASTDFNSQTNPFFYCGVSGLTVATNHVPYDGFNGCIYNIDYGGNFGSQVAISSTGEMYYRRKYITWGDWVKVAKASQIEALENDYCILSEFTNIFCAGDSLTWGAVYTGSGSSDFRAAKKPYNDVLALRTGSTVARNAQPGIDAIGYVSKLSSITEKTNQLCIIYLGTNGGLTDTIATDAPGDDKSQYDLTTETGAYCYIVKHCLDVNAKVLLVKIYAGGGTNGVSTTNTVIGKVAEKFGVAVIDNESLPQKYHIWPNGQGYDYTHLNDFGYAAFAEYLIRQVNQLEPTMLARLLPDS